MNFKFFLIFLVFFSKVLSQEIKSLINFNIVGNENENLFLSANDNGQFNKIGNQINIQNFYVSKNKKYESYSSISLGSNSNILSLDFKINSKFGSIHLGKILPQTNKNSFKTEMIFSKNAEGIPGISYYSKPKQFKNNTLLFEIYQGKFQSQDNYSNAPFLHYKSLEVQNQNNRFMISFKLQHAVQFGGETFYGKSIPVTPKIFFDVLTGGGGNKSQTVIDQGYKVGNGLGSYTFLLRNTNSKINYSIYYEHYFDDLSGMKLKNLGDGVFGLMLEKNNNYFQYEYIDTTNQSGNQHPPGVDSYYWHQTYRFGWTNKGESLGNIFISPLNNRKRIHHLSVKYHFKHFDMSIQSAKEKNYIPYNFKNNNEPIENSNSMINSNIFSGIILSKKISSNMISLGYYFDNKNKSISNIMLSYQIQL